MVTDWRSTLDEAKSGDFGIIGDPVAHSLSPVFQTPALGRWWTLAGRRSADAPVYRLFHVAPIDLPEAVSELHRKLAGWNVTVPHKTAVVELMDRVDSFAHETGAVNTVKVEQGALVGYNTDGLGFARALDEDMDVRPQTAVVLGAGGTGQVIVHQLLALEVERIYWWNRTPDRLAPLLAALPDERKAVRPVTDPRALKAACAEAGLIVNATSVGLKAGDGPPAPGLEFRRGAAAFDVIYHRETAFLKQARRSGAIVCGGLPMLLYQGAAAFEIWTGEKAPVGLMKQALIKAVHEKGIEPVWPSDI